LRHAPQPADVVAHFGDALHGSNFGVQVEYWWK